MECYKIPGVKFIQFITDDLICVSLCWRRCYRHTVAMQSFPYDSFNFRLSTVSDKKLVYPIFLYFLLPIFMYEPFERSLLCGATNLLC